MSAKLIKSKFVRRPLSEIKICQSSVFRCPCRSYPRTYWANSFLILPVASLGTYPRRFLNFWKIRDPLGAKTSKCYSSLKSLFQSFHTFSKFSSQCSSQKLLFWIFEILRFWFFTIFFVFFNMGPYGSQNFKMLLLPQVTCQCFQFFSEVYSEWSWQKYCFRFLKF